MACYVTFILLLIHYPVQPSNIHQLEYLKKKLKNIICLPLHIPIIYIHNPSVLSIHTLHFSGSTTFIPWYQRRQRRRLCMCDMFKNQRKYIFMQYASMWNRYLIRKTYLCILNIRENWSNTQYLDSLYIYVHTAAADTFLYETFVVLFFIPFSIHTYRYYTHIVTGCFGRTWGVLQFFHISISFFFVVLSTTLGKRDIKVIWIQNVRIRYERYSFYYQIHLDVYMKPLK